jgi:hypothetical protein
MPNAIFDKADISNETIHPFSQFGLGHATSRIIRRHIYGKICSGMGSNDKSRIWVRYKGVAPEELDVIPAIREVGVP